MLFSDARSTASDTQPLRCRAGEEGVRVKFRGETGSPDTYGYFMVGERWIVVRYPHDRMGDPDHIWFGVSSPESPGTLTPTLDEPFDTARHGTPCSGWLQGPPPGDAPDGRR